MNKMNFKISRENKEKKNLGILNFLVMEKNVLHQIIIFAFSLLIIGLISSILVNATQGDFSKAANIIMLLFIPIYVFMMGVLFATRKIEPVTQWITFGYVILFFSMVIGYNPPPIFSSLLIAIFTGSIILSIANKIINNKK